MAINAKSSTPTTTTNSGRCCSERIEMSFFRKKPVAVEAMQFDGGLQSAMSIQRWAHAGRDPAMNSIIIVQQGWSSILVRTLEGEMRAGPGDWIIKGIKGEFYPCDNDIFRATYEPIEPDDFPLGEACDLSGEGSCESCQ